MKGVLIYFAVLAVFPLLVILLSWVTTPIGIVITIILRRLRQLQLTEDELVGPVAGATLLHALMATVVALWCTRWALRKTGLVLDWALVLLLLFVGLLNNWLQWKDSEGNLKLARLGELYGNALGLALGRILLVS